MFWAYDSHEPYQDSPRSCVTRVAGGTATNNAKTWGTSIYSLIIRPWKHTWPKLSKNVLSRAAKVQSSTVATQEAIGSATQT